MIKIFYIYTNIFKTQTMKKILLQFTSLALLCLTASAQIPNADFEGWTVNELDGWTTTNSVAVPNSVTPFLGVMPVRQPLNLKQKVTEAVRTVL
jgi:hypothetical protein